MSQSISQSLSQLLSWRVFEWKIEWVSEAVSRLIIKSIHKYVRRPVKALANQSISFFGVSQILSDKVSFDIAVQSLLLWGVKILSLMHQS